MINASAAKPAAVQHPPPVRRSPLSAASAESSTPVGGSAGA
jgi:hypothetical protein